MPPERRFGKIQNLALLVLRDFERCRTAKKDLNKSAERQKNTWTKKA